MNPDDDGELTFESFITANEVRKVLNIQIFEPEEAEEDSDE